MQINNFPEKILLDSDDSIPIQQANGITKRVTKDNLLAGISGGGSYPVSFTHWHDESFIEIGAQLKIDTNIQLAYATEIYQHPPAINDSFSFNKLLVAGNYNLSVLTILNANLGKLKLEIDGNLAFDDMDFYSPSIVINVVLQRTITIPIDGLHEFKFTVFTKNASSSNYYFSGRKIWARKI